MKVYQINPKYNWIELTIEYDDFVELRIMTKDEFKRKYAEQSIVSLDNNNSTETTIIKMKINGKKVI